MFCTNCGKEIDDGSTFCTNCGTPIEEHVEEEKDKTLFCTSCGSKLEDGQAFCTECGASVDGDSAPEGVSASNADQKTFSLPKVDLPKVQAPHLKSASGSSISLDAKNKGLIIGIVVAGIVLVIALIAVLVMVFNQPQNPKVVYKEIAASSSSSSAYSSASSSSKSSASSSSSATSSNKDYILPDSDKKYLQASDLRGLSDWELYVARNEIFARHGRGFKNEDLVKYFKDKDWYTERYSPSQFDSMPSPLNDYELKNSILIRGTEEQRGSSYLN